LIPIIFGLFGAMLVPDLAWAADEGGYRLGFLQILILMIVTLGPLKLIAPFAAATRGLPLADRRRLALQSAVIGTSAVTLGGVIGSLVASNWGLSTPILTVTAGLIFFLVALRAVLAQYAHPTTVEPPPPGAPSPFAIAFPILVTPYGIAAVVTLVSLFHHDIPRLIEVTIAVLAVMAMNLVAMLFVQVFTGPALGSLLLVTGAIFGVLQVALAIRILAVGLHDLVVPLIQG
jgi:multiple antibiotic resistance protein